MKYLFLLSSLFLCLLQASAQQRTVSGKVQDTTGAPIPGATVIVKGTNIGTAAGADGVFQISVPGNNAVLIVSSIGFREREVPVNGHATVNVRLQGGKDLEGVVVMGFSKVEKRHVASSVAEMDMKQAKTRPVAKMEEVFSGTIPGVTMQQASNLPGARPGAISIRGISTLQNADPLVIVDGMEMSLSDIDPNQVKSITILKDAASASMYGSRGANGVIVIETERGSTGKFKVDLNTWYAMSKPIDNPKFVNGADYMRLNNEARIMQGQTPSFSEDSIRKMESGELKSINWLDEVIQRNATSSNTALNVSGGGGVGTFNLMLGYLNEGGLNNIEGTQKFSARFNTNINIADKFVLLADFYAHRLQVDRLLANDDGHGLYALAWRMNPSQQVFYPNTGLGIEDHYQLHSGINPLASINHGGTKNYMHDWSTINLRPRYNITKNLNIEGNVSYVIKKSAEKWQRSTFKFYDEVGKPVTTWANSVGATQNVSESQLTTRMLVNYTANLRGRKDKIYVTGGAESMSWIFSDFKEISKASFFGKLNYSFDSRYILEVTARGDGSSKFAPGNRWGFFPSAAVAWNVTNERFMKPIVKSGVIDNLRFRGSYGEIGNEDVKPYLWEEIVNNYGWTMRMPNPNFSWEKQKQWNVGMELTTLNKRLSFVGEIYSKHSFDLIYDEFSVPPLTGSHTLESAVNIGEVENKGFELSLKWNDKIGDLHYSIGGMLFDNKNKVLKAGYRYNDTLIFKDNANKVWYRGIAIDNYYGYESNGYFRDADDLDKTAAKLPNALPGDIKYVDQNGDGVINNLDRVNLGDPFPHMNYAINLDLQYKRWDFSVIGQGVGKRIGYLSGLEGYPVHVDGNTNALGAPRQYYADNRWTPENPNSRFPRVWNGASTNTYMSDVWLGDASFFRIKMLQLGYTFPKIGRSIHNVRVYVNAQDAITFTKWEGLEPERNGGGGRYPRMAVYSIGLKASMF